MSLTFLYMGVANLTPNSFSDGNPELSQKIVLDKLNHLLDWCDILDIGFESTAPMNQAIDEETELRRFQEHFQGLLAGQSIDLTGKTLSIDTYKPQVFRKIYEEIKGSAPQVKMIWNDISGVVDDETLDLLKSNLDFDYVLNHTGVPNKLEANNHLNFISNAKENNLIEEMDQFFIDQMKKIQKLSHKKIWFDPGFGFSKNLEQNLYLLNNLDQLLMRSNYQNWLIGMSRKSFLRPKNHKEVFKSKGDLLAFTETLQFEKIKQFLSRIENEKFNLIFRLHTPILKLMLD
ncbi:dihydropteroate synthase [Bacteriovoracaceae bacterium]|nr:dihydropteroate synthase [Bacteriovoracaceae bacterium]